MSIFRLIRQELKWKKKSSAEKNNQTLAEWLSSKSEDIEEWRLYLKFL